MKQMKSSGSPCAAESGFTAAEVAEILEYPNQCTGSRFTVSAKQTLALLEKLYARGYQIEDIKTVIDLKVSQWLYVPAMQKYLRPATLIDGYNFPRYLDEVTKSAGRDTSVQNPKSEQP